MILKYREMLVERIKTSSALFEKYDNDKSLYFLFSNNLLFN